MESPSFAYCTSAWTRPDIFEVAIRRLADNRIAVLRHEVDEDVWLRGTLEEGMAFQRRCSPEELTQMERTDGPRFRRKAGAAATGAAA